jgi:hypothetical protein
MVVFEVCILFINLNKKDFHWIYFLVYDILTGDTKLCLRVSNHYHESREKCVRDVSWHPYENYIISTSVNISICTF